MGEGRRELKATDCNCNNLNINQGPKLRDLTTNGTLSLFFQDKIVIH